MSADIVIEGAGVIVASIAYHLAPRGCDVLVVDRIVRARGDAPRVLGQDEKGPRGT